jgi:hypothetical protein
MKQDLGPLGMIDLLTDKELRESLGHHFDSIQRDWVRGIKLIRLPIGVGQSDGDGNQIAPVIIPGPQSGYVWDLKRITVSGPAIYTSTSSAFLNLYRGATQEDILDATFMAGLTVSNATTWPKLALTFFGGESLAFTGGNFGVSSEFYVNGQVLEVPAEMVGKLVLCDPGSKRAGYWYRGYLGA